MKKEVFINGRKIVYFEEGEGFPFLLIHGWGGAEAPEDFLDFQSLLAKEGFRVYLPCLPGFGESDKPDPNWRMADYTNCLLDFAQKLGIGNFFLLGHSFGGLAALRIASDFPSKVRALILCSPAILGPRLTFFEMFRAVLFYSFLIGARMAHILFSPALLILKKLRQSGRKANWIIRFFEKIKKIQKFYFKDKMAEVVKKLVKGEDAVILLKKIKCPTLVVWGGKDFVNPLQIASAAGHLFDYTFKIIPEASHSFQRDNANKLVQLITDFLIDTHR